MKLVWNRQAGQMWIRLSAVLVAVMAATISASPEVMTNHWFVQLKDDLGPDAAMTVAKRNGFSYIAPVSSAEARVWKLVSPDTSCSDQNILFISPS